jgi:hypothetical protein
MLKSIALTGLVALSIALLHSPSVAQDGFNPEMIDDLAISPKLIRKHKLDRSQHECEKCVVAVQQHGFYRGRTDEIA